MSRDLLNPRKTMSQSVMPNTCRELPKRTVLATSIAALLAIGSFGSAASAWAQAETIAAKSEKPELSRNEPPASGFVPVIREGEGLTPANSNLPRMAPGRSDRIIELTTARNDIPADGQTRVRLRVRVLDPKDQVVKEDAIATVNFSAGRLQLLDRPLDETTPYRGDRSGVVPGVQVALKDGVAEFDLIAPSEARDVEVRVLAYGNEVIGTLRFVPDKRELVGIGVIEGLIALNKNRTDGVRDDGVEKDLRNIQREFANGRGSAGLSARMFFKGLVKGDYLLTLSYDSDKDSRSRLFRDIQPEEYYPVYGDSSLKGFDARTAARLYVRVDKDRSYVLYGDIQTAAQFESMALANYQRSLTGFKWHGENERFSANVFAARDNVRQVVEEQPARGISGPYFVSNLTGIRNSERVELVTRDRNQPAVILQVQAQARFVDYTFEPFSGQVIFKGPVPTLDSNLNPISVRITYEVEQGGEKFWVAGADGQFKLSKDVAVGGSIARDENPLARYTLGGLNATAKLGANTVLLAEIARSDGRGASQTVAPSLPVTANSGNAARIELRAAGEAGSLRAYAARAEEGFYNPSSSLAAGRTEAAVRGELKLSNDLKGFTEAVRTQDDVNGAKRTGVTAGVSLQMSKAFTVDVFGRTSRDQGAAVTSTVTDSNLGTFNPGAGQNLSPFTLNAQQGVAPRLTNATSVGVRSRYQWTEKSAVFGEVESEVDGARRDRFQIGADYQIWDSVRVYGRHEWITSTSGLYDAATASNPGASTRTTTFGVASSYMRNGDVYSEYRIRDSISGYESQAAAGIRNTWPLREGVAMLTSLERVKSIDFRPANGSSGFPSGNPTDAIAGALGVELTYSPDWKASGKIEARQDTQNTQLLSTLAGAMKLDRNFTGLARNYYNRTFSRTGQGARTENRFQLGVAWRDVDTNVWSALGRYEYRYAEGKACDVNGFCTGDLIRASIIAGTVNYHPSRPWWISGQAAYRYDHAKIDGSNSIYMLGGRVIYDITERWDVSAAGFMLASPNGGGRQYASGLEGGYLLGQNLWLSVGFNWRGFSNDLGVDDYTNRGVYIRLRTKFDESLFGINRDDKTRTPDVPRVGP